MLLQHGLSDSLRHSPIDPRQYCYAANAIAAAFRSSEASFLLERAMALWRFFECFLNEGPDFAVESQGRHAPQAKSLGDECSDSRRSVTLRVAGRCLVGGELILLGVAADQRGRTASKRNLNECGAIPQRRFRRVADVFGAAISECAWR
jgi:hypothetical protein